GLPSGRDCCIIQLYHDVNRGRSQMSEQFDLIAIGGGSGGIAASLRAARHGARCALVADAALGGTCVHLGCVPKKILWHAADIASSIGDASDYGFASAPGVIDWGRLKQSRDEYLARLAGIYRDRLAEAGVTLIEGRASFVEPRMISVNGA